MPRAIWKGHVAFGLVNLPVELHKAVQDHRPHFKLLCAEGRSAVRYKRVCEKSGREVSWNNLEKGYEYQKGKFVVLNRKDFETAALEKSRTIDILDFVQAEEVDDRYFERPYYLVPGPGGERAYALLRAALGESGRMGIGKMILREAQHLVSLEVVDDVLTLNLMRFADELVDASKLRVPKAKAVAAKELKLARSIVDALTDPWDPAKYTDDYRDNLMRLIRAKIKGREPKLEEDVPEREAKVVDLMERLRQSLEQGKSSRKAAPRRKSKKRAVAKSRRKARSTAA